MHGRGQVYWSTKVCRSFQWRSRACMCGHMVDGYRGRQIYVFVAIAMSKPSSSINIGVLESECGDETLSILARAPYSTRPTDAVCAGPGNRAMAKEGTVTDLITQSTALMGQLKAGELREIELTIEPEEHARAQSERYRMLMAAHQQLVVMAYAAGFKVSQYYRKDGTYVTEIWRGERPKHKQLEQRDD